MTRLDVLADKNVKNTLSSLRGLLLMLNLPTFASKSKFQ